MKAPTRRDFAAISALAPKKKQLNKASVYCNLALGCTLPCLPFRFSPFKLKEEKPSRTRL
jgi:hypothetical protein